jgi:hypothetical protein
VAFDTRPSARGDAPGRYARGLLDALRATADERDEIVETHRPRGVDVFHTPWIEGAMLHSPCPMIVTLGDLAPLTRRSEHLRCGGVHLRLRHLALLRATHVIVPAEHVAQQAVAELGLERERIVVIPLAEDPAHDRDERGEHAWTWREAGRATWHVYADALARPERPCVGGLRPFPLYGVRLGRP